MSKWVALGAVIFIVLIITGAYWQGYNHRGEVEKVRNAEADKAQLDEEREIRNAVNKLDDTGLRNTILMHNERTNE